MIIIIILRSVLDWQLASGQGLAGVWYDGPYYLDTDIVSQYDQYNQYQISGSYLFTKWEFRCCSQSCGITRGTVLPPLQPQSTPNGAVSSTATPSKLQQQYQQHQQEKEKEGCAGQWGPDGACAVQQEHHQCRQHQQQRCQTPGGSSTTDVAAFCGGAAAGDAASAASIVESFPRRRLCLGTGEAQLGRAEMFRQHSGVAVVLKQRMFDVPALNGKREVSACNVILSG